MKCGTSGGLALFCQGSGPSPAKPALLPTSEGGALGAGAAVGPGARLSAR